MLVLKSFSFGWTSNLKIPFKEKTCLEHRYIPKDKNNMSKIVLKQVNILKSKKVQQTEFYLLDRKFNQSFTFEY